ncbi:acyl-CoA thioester hydrolase/BAAT C-terminal domain-containing protein [Providencia stuartii]|uniref:acyl-CoA thioester hydrolase/BAAT C-terminal domain-containing protein n=1 Tax=Providencia stuartii TaxID=588 RepID=UPI000C9A0637|nr:acyl-CoA thioester hydrolase/BAAT C-terminal domain-containing protein [Providencia stuartii]SUC47047.1 Uncharacterised protein [Providencia stuartii]HEM8216279.1 alpha/beta hydrolase [Providencia stuartii]
MKIGSVILLLVAFTLTAHAEKGPELQKIQDKQGKEIHYYIIKQSDKTAKNVLVLLQGSDCKSVINNTKMIKNFGAAFPNNDILLVEKTGLDSQVGKNEDGTLVENCPVDYMKNDSPLERAENYLFLIGHLKNHYQHIILLGGSEGAVVTNLIVSNTDMIQASISLNGGGQFFINDVIYNIEKTLPNEEVAQSIEGFKQFAKSVIQNKLDDNQFPSEHGEKWWREMLTVNNQKLLQSIKTPHLVIQTMDDINVDPHSVVRMMGKINNPQVSFKTYQGLDHFFLDQEGKSQTELIVKDINEWYQTIN